MEEAPRLQVPEGLWVGLVLVLNTETHICSGQCYLNCMKTGYEKTSLYCVKFIQLDTANSCSMTSFFLNTQVQKK